MGNTILCHDYDSLVDGHPLQEAHSTQTCVEACSTVQHSYAAYISLQYANLLPPRKDRTILPASQHMNHHLPAGIAVYFLV